MTEPTYATDHAASPESDDGPMCTVGFPFGFLLGLPLGIFLWLPETMLIGAIYVDLLHLPKNMSNSAGLLFLLALYVVWLLLVLAPLPVLLVRKLVGRLDPAEKRPRFGFFRGLFCSLPLATLYIDVIWTSGTH
jgi:hypothetical protein